MRVLVTGSTGFLGRHLCRHLERAGCQVVALSSSSCDLRLPGSLEPFCDTSFDYIYHLAAWTQAGDFCLFHPGEQWLINQQINTHTLEWWQRAQPQAKLIAIGSSCCYDTAWPLREENLLEGKPIESLFAYGMTKRMMYVGLEALRQQFGLRYLFLVPNTLYGPGYHLDGRQSHFIFDLVRKIVAHKLGIGGLPTLWGNGEQSREIVHVDDFAGAALELSRKVDNQIVNVGTGVEYSIRWYAEQICALAGVDAGQVQYDLTRHVGAKSKLLCIDKLKTLIPGYVPTDTRTGLKELVDWFSDILIQ